MYFCLILNVCVFVFEQIWDLESKAVVAELIPEFPERISKHALVPYPISVAWSADGSTLYTGYTDGIIRVWKVSA